MPYYNNPIYTGYNPTPNAYGTALPGQQQQPDPIFRWVSGRAGADAFSMAPGQKAFLMDSNEPILYAKATDSYGRYTPLQSYKLVPIEDQANTPAQITAQPAESIDYEKIRQMISEEVAKISNNHPTRKGDK